MVSNMFQMLLPIWIFDAYFEDIKDIFIHLTASQIAVGLDPPMVGWFGGFVSPPDWFWIHLGSEQNSAFRSSVPIIHDKLGLVWLVTNQGNII